MTEALEQLRAAGEAVTSPRLGAPTPCAKWTVAQVIEHAAGDQLAWAAALGTGRGPQYDPFDPPARLDGRVDELLAPAIAAAGTAWAAVAPDAGPVGTPLPQGALPAATAAAACALDAAVHAWDVASGVGRPAALSPELAARLLPAAREIVEPLRQYGVYAAALPPEPGDDSAAELLRYLGRDPHWRP
ncbi:MAG TPA: TIGR03086 family metal-binding protein [Streptosporangiaceae bacterium]